MSEKTEIIKYKLVKEFSIKFMENSYVGQAYSFSIPTRIVFTLDLVGENNEKFYPTVKGACGFYNTEEGFYPSDELYEHIIEKLCFGFVYDTEEKEREVRSAAEDMAMEVMQTLYYYIETQECMGWLRPPSK